MNLWERHPKCSIVLKLRLYGEIVTAYVYGKTPFLNLLKYFIESFQLNCCEPSKQREKRIEKQVYVYTEQ